MSGACVGSHGKGKEQVKRRRGGGSEKKRSEQEVVDTLVGVGGDAGERERAGEGGRKDGPLAPSFISFLHGEMCVLDASISLS